jgi:hypothetical protein
MKKKRIGKFHPLFFLTKIAPGEVMWIATVPGIMTISGGNGPIYHFFGIHLL